MAGKRRMVPGIGAGLRGVRAAVPGRVPSRMAGLRKAAIVGGLVVGGAVLYGVVSTTLSQRAKTVKAPNTQALGQPAIGSLTAVKPTIGYTPNAHFVTRSDEPTWVQNMAVWVPPAPTTTRAKVLARIMAAPMTCIGLLYGLTTGTLPTVRDGVFCFSAGFGPLWRLYVSKDTNAITFGHTIICKTEPTPALWRHELAHTRQCERLSVGFGLVYLWSQWVYGYGRNPLERAARRAALERPTSPTFWGAAATLVPRV